MQKIMVIDDEGFVDIIKKVMEREGFEVISALSGKECLEKLAAEEPDLILLDIMMPEMDGFEFANAVKQNKKFKDIPIFVVTALDLSEEESELLSKKAQAVILKKTMSADTIADQISKLLNSQKS